MQTECKADRYRFQDLGSRRVEADFCGGTLTSDGGALLLREVEKRYGLIESLASCFEDHREAGLIEHSVRDLLAQRVMGLALGYEDLNDHDDLRRDPLLAVAVGKTDPEGGDRHADRDRGCALAGKSTLNRLELSAGERDEYKKTPVDPEKVKSLFVDWFIARQEAPPRLLILDVDTSCNVVHGTQEGRHFHGFYDAYCYLPLFVFCGPWLLSARLKSSQGDATEGTVEDLDRIVAQLRQAWPGVEIWVRGDSSFAREEIMSWCESEGVHYVFGYCRNVKLAGMITSEMAQARQKREETGRAARVFADLHYRTRRSWSRPRRVVAKAEHTAEGANPRYLVTSLPVERIGPRELYEQTYCARGDMENRLKEQQMGLFSDRTSTRRLKSNQLRLWFSATAYWMLQLMREVALKGTRLARAQCWTIRNKLLRIGARVRVSVRRVAVHLATGCPYQDVFARAWENLVPAGT